MRLRAILSTFGEAGDPAAGADRHPVQSLPVTVLC